MHILTKWPSVANYCPLRHDYHRAPNTPSWALLPGDYIIFHYYCVRYALHEQTVILSINIIITPALIKLVYL